MKRLLDHGDRLRLVRDRSQDNRDRYGRLLRYVERGDATSAESRSDGDGRRCTSSSDRSNGSAKYRKAKSRAKATRRGVWDRCGGDFHKPL